VEGGLTLLRALRYLLQLAAALVSAKVRCLVVACNTACAASLRALRERYPGLPVIGVIEPGAQAAVQASVSQRIADA
jgi:glutamate racemase